MKVRVTRPKKSNLERLVTPIVLDKNEDRLCSDEEVILLEAFLQESRQEGYCGR